MVLRLVNSSERKKPPTSSTPTIQANGTPGVNVAQAATNVALMSALTVSTALKPKCRRMIGDGGLHAHRADDAGEGDEPRLERR